MLPRAIYSLLVALHLISTACYPWQNLSLFSREMGDWSHRAHFCAGDWQWAVWAGTSWLLAQQGQSGHQNHSRRGYVRRGLHRGGWSHDVSSQNKSTQRCLGEDVLCGVLYIHSDAMSHRFAAQIYWWFPVAWRIKSNSSPAWSTRPVTVLPCPLASLIPFLVSP